MARAPLLPEIDTIATLKGSRPIEDLPPMRKAGRAYAGRADYLELFNHLPIGKFVEVKYIYYRSLSGAATRYNKAAYDKRIKVSHDTQRGVVVVMAMARGNDLKEILA